MSPSPLAPPQLGTYDGETEAAGDRDALVESDCDGEGVPLAELLAVALVDPVKVGELVPLPLTVVEGVYDGLTLAVKVVELVTLLLTLVDAVKVGEIVTLPLAAVEGVKVALAEGACDGVALALPDGEPLAVAGTE